MFSFFNSIPQQDYIDISNTKIQAYRAFISTLENPKCFTLSPSYIMLIVDSGASVCISPICSDFVTYKNSQMKINDLSSLNKVKGEGIISRTVLDTSGQKIKLEVPGYHIPGVEVFLLSPQILLKLLGGNFFGTTEGIMISLENGLNLQATYCPRSCLPLIPLPFDINK